MRFLLEIQSDTAAFHPEPLTELVDILHRVADDLNTNLDPFGEDKAKIRDTNGNTVGSWAYQPPAQEDPDS